GRITVTGHVTEFVIPVQAGQVSRPSGITAGPDGNIWFVDAGRGGIGRLSFPQPAVMTTPAPQSTLGGATAAFPLDPTNGATQYWLDLGTSPHGTDLYSASAGTNLSATVMNALPANGPTVYARLWSLIAGAWSFNDYTYNTADGRAAMTGPAPGTSLAGAS